MNRRGYLSVIGGTTVLAGCSAISEDDTTSSDSGGNNTTNSSGENTSSDPPVESASFELVESDIPEVMNADEDASISITVKNTGGSTGSCSGQARIKKEEVESGTLRFGYYNDTIEPEEKKKMEITGEVPAGTGEYVFEFTNLEETRTTTITDENATPTIQNVNIVSEWDEYGDLISNAIDSVTVGETATIVGRYTAFVHDGTYQATTQTRIYEKSTDERVFITSDESEQIVGRNGYSSWEAPINFDTTGWRPGVYRAEFTVRDDISEEVSGTETTTFQVVE